jgi:hypothetical protein
MRASSKPKKLPTSKHAAAKTFFAVLSPKSSAGKAESFKIRLFFLQSVGFGVLALAAPACL